MDASYLSKNMDYVTLLEQVDLSFPTQNKHQIAVDMGRTFPDEAFFQTNKQSGEREDSLQEQLGKEVLEAISRVCTAYSTRNVHIGYCQGFNFIVGRLL